MHVINKPLLIKKEEITNIFLHFKYVDIIVLKNRESISPYMRMRGCDNPLGNHNPTIINKGIKNIT